jgi:hypothetical protein
MKWKAEIDTPCPAVELDAGLGGVSRQIARDYPGPPGLQAAKAR